MLHRHFILSLLLVSLGFASIACGPPPKPKELDQLQAMRDEITMAEMQQTAPEMLELSEKLYKMSRKSWQDDELPKAREYAWLGQVRYRTAEAINNVSKEQERFKAAELEANQVRHQLELAKVQVTATEKSIVQLQDTIKAVKEGASAKARSEVDQLLLSVEAERERARAVNAEEFGAGPYNLGENSLKMAKAHLDAGQLQDAVKELGAAQKAYKDAIAEATPEFEKTQSSAQKAEREKALFDDATNAFGANALKDSRGVVLVFPALFKKGKTSPLSAKDYLIDKAIEIAKNYPETTILVEGYTQSKGSSSKNLTISQSRADSVRDLLLQGGVDAKRMVTTGYGEEKARYDNSDRDIRAKNDRVELVFVMTE